MIAVADTDMVFTDFCDEVAGTACDSLDFNALLLGASQPQ